MTRHAAPPPRSTGDRRYSKLLYSVVERTVPIDQSRGVEDHAGNGTVGVIEVTRQEVVRPVGASARSDRARLVSASVI